MYIICEETDGSFIAPSGISNSVEDAISKIEFNMRLMQTYFAESLYENGFQRKTFHCKENDVGKIMVKIFHSKLKLSETKNMNPGDLYKYFHNGMQINDCL